MDEEPSIVTVTHSFLAEPGIWNAEGYYTDEFGRTVQARGTAHIIHGDTLWINEGSITVCFPEPVEIFNHYEIKPFKPHESRTTWVSRNPALGRLMGDFIIVSDSILSLFRSATGDYRGFEYLLRLSHERYVNRGVLLRGEVMMSSWSMELVRRSDL